VEGFPLPVPSVTPVTPVATQSLPLSSVNSPSQSTSDVNLPTGLPTGNNASSPSNGGGGPTPTNDAGASPQESQGGTGSTGRKSGTIRVGNRTEIMSLLFSFCLLVMFLA
jgi:hypothetical protein